MIMRITRRSIARNSSFDSLSWFLMSIWIFASPRFSWIQIFHHLFLSNNEYIIVELSSVSGWDIISTHLYMIGWTYFFIGGKVMVELNLFYCIYSNMFCIMWTFLNKNHKSIFMIWMSCLLIKDFIFLVVWMLEAIFQSSSSHSLCQVSLISLLISQHSSSSMQTSVLLWKFVQT